MRFRDLCAVRRPRTSGDVPTSGKLALQHSEAIREGLDVRRLVGCRDLHAQPRMPLGDHREAETDHEDAEFKQALRHGDRLRGVVHDDRTDRGRALENLETRLTDAGAGCVDALRLPDCTAARTRTSRSGSWMWMRPLLIVSTTDAETSTPSTRRPFVAKMDAVGRPI